MKKLILAALCVVILVAVGVGVSYAFFSDTETSENNIIASGSIHIKQHGLDIQAGTLRPGTLVEKTVTVENTGTNPAYVRTCIAVPKGSDTVDWLELDCDQDKWGWSVAQNVTLDGVVYTVYVATYKEKLMPGQTTEPSLKGLSVDPALDYDGSTYRYVVNGEVTALDLPQDLKIRIATEAVQTTTFDDAAQALETAFGTVATGNNPWTWEGKRDPLDADPYIPNTVVYGETATTES